jgi:hypothetical protein
VELSGRLIEKVVWVSSIYTVEAAGVSDRTREVDRAAHFN